MLHPQHSLQRIGLLECARLILCLRLGCWRWRCSSSVRPITIVTKSQILECVRGHEVAEGPTLLAEILIKILFWVVMQPFRLPPGRYDKEMWGWICRQGCYDRQFRRDNERKRLEVCRFASSGVSDLTRRQE